MVKLRFLWLVLLAATPVGGYAETAREKKPTSEPYEWAIMFVPLGRVQPFGAGVVVGLGFQHRLRKALGFEFSAGYPLGIDFSAGYPTTSAKPAIEATGGVHYFPLGAALKGFSSGGNLDLNALFPDNPSLGVYPEIWGTFGYQFIWGGSVFSSAVGIGNPNPGIVSRFVKLPFGLALR